MLTGYIKIKDKEMLKEFQDYYKLETPEEIYYEIKGLDAITSLNLYLIGEQSGSESTETFRIKQRFFDFNKGEDTVKYRFEGDTVGFEKVVMNRRLDVKDTGNLSTNMENLLLATQISAGISYTKRYKPPQQVKTIGVEAAYEKTREVEIDEEGFKGKIVRNLGVIQLLEFENKFLKFHLSEVTTNDVFEETIDLSQTYFYKIQKKDNLDRIMSYTPIKNMGYKLNEETLGIPYEGDVKREIVNVGGVYTDIDDVIAHHPEKNTEWIKDRKYVIVTDEILDEVIQSFLDYDGYIAMDTETSGLNINFKSRANEAAQLVGLVLSKEEKTGYYFPLQHKLFKNLCDGDHYYFMRKYAKTLLETKDIVCHNGAYDWKVCYIYGINTNIVADTMLAFAVTKQYETPSYQIGLKALAASLLGNDMFDLDDFLVSGSLKNSNIAFWDLNYEIVRRYAPADADMTLTLWHYIRENKLLEEYNAEKVFQIEVEFSKVVAYSEFFGYRLDVEETSQLEADLKQQLAELEKEIYKMAGKEFNLRSPAQLSEVMFDELGIERIKGNSTGTKDVLKPLSKKTNADGSVKYPFVKVLKEYRDIDSIYTKFLTKLPQHMTPDGYIFSRTNQTGTTTGRVSVNDPNYQSFNDTVKKHIVPRPGYIMFDSDFSQIEYRVLCSLAHEKAIIEEFKDPDLDYHRYQAARMFSVPYASVTDALRSQSKGINFGLPYGMGDMSLGAAVFGERTPENGKKAAVLRNKYFEGQENILKFFENVRATGVDRGYTETYWGRRRYYQRGKFNEASIRRQAGNHTIQGCLHICSYVHTLEDGVVQIGKIVGKERHIWDGKGWSKCFIASTGKKQECIIKFRGGLTMKTSPDHKFLVVSHRGKERFVPCKDLLTLETTKNAHRVRVNLDYKPSEHKYSSKEFYKYKGHENRTNNVFLEDIGDSFKAGVFLGRLASDGSVTRECDTQNRAVHIVAEHEFNILPELRATMENLPLKEYTEDVREGRTERLKRLNVYSKTLVSEIRELDIKHHIDDRIFADTEMLRGFLRGLFDGDGGVAGDVITFTMGVQEDFSEYCQQIQKALLFFGIRSYYRYYPGDRHVVSIKMADTPIFLDRIGFMNPDKQLKARQIEAKQDEHIFGRVLQVESVEITDEYVDMYDVCNTERGYFVSDGVVTHNSAADVYKLAVIRLFHAIVANRWLGKALINCFVHDEVLMEISKEINPYYFVKVWQNAFQLKIENFANLYSGMGFGKSWYVAKKADFPVQYCTALAEKYYKGMPWNQDLDGFLDDINNGYKEYKTQRVIDYIEENIEILKKTDPTESEKEIQTQGEIIKPIIGQLLQAEVQNLLKNEEFKEQKVKEHNYSEKEIEILTGEISNNQLNEQELDKQLQEQLKIFTEYHKIIGEYKIVSPGAIQEENSEFTEEDYKKGLASTQTKTSKNLQLLVNGYSIDKTNKILYILDNVWYDEIKGKYQSAAKSVEEYIKYLHGDYDVALYANTEAMKKDKSTKYFPNKLSDLDISVLEANLKIKNQQIKDILKNHSNKAIKGSIITDNAIEIFIPENERFKGVDNEE